MLVIEITRFKTGNLAIRKIGEVVAVEAFTIATLFAVFRYASYGVVYYLLSELSSATENRQHEQHRTTHGRAYFFGATNNTFVYLKTRSARTDGS